MKYTADQYEHFWTSELGKVVRAGRDRLRAACPVHEGDSPYTLSINLVTGYAHCFKCHGDGEGWSRSAKLRNLAFGYEIDIRSIELSP